MAYTAAVTTPMKKAITIGPGIGFFAGKCNVTDYDSGTLVEITAITKYFRASGVSGFTHGLIAVIPSGVSDSGFNFEWDYTNGGFHAYTPTSFAIAGSATGKAVTFTGSLLAAASTAGSLAAVAAEATAVTDVGEVGFFAIGFI